MLFSSLVFSFFKTKAALLDFIGWNNYSHVKAQNLRPISFMLSGRNRKLINLTYHFMNRTLSINLYQTFWRVPISLFQSFISDSFITRTIFVISKILYRW